MNKESHSSKPIERGEVFLFVDIDGKVEQKYHQGFALHDQMVASGNAFRSMEECMNSPIYKAFRR